MQEGAGFLPYSKVQTLIQQSDKLAVNVSTHSFRRIWVAVLPLISLPTPRTALEPAPACSLHPFFRHLSTHSHLFAIDSRRSALSPAPILDGTSASSVRDRNRISTENLKETIRFLELIDSQHDHISCRPRRTPQDWHSALLIEFATVFPSYGIASEWLTVERNPHSDCGRNSTLDCSTTSSHRNWKLVVTLVLHTY